MRIALNGWFLDQPGTGSGQYLHGLLGAMATVGQEHEQEREYLLVVPRGQIELAIPDLRIRLWCYSSRWWRTNLGKVLFEQVAFPWACRRWGADVAHVPYWGSPLRPPVPTVVTVHDLIPMLLPPYRGGVMVRLYTSLVAASARRAAGVVTDSLASKRDIEKHLGLPTRKVCCIYLAVGEEFCPEPGPDDDAVRQQFGLPLRYVLYLAGHDVRKNVATLIEAFATVAQAVDDAQLVVGGTLPGADRRPSFLRGASPLFDPRPLVRELGLEDDVLFLGWVDDDHKPALLRGAACAVFPSRYEGFGLPVLEALACSAPLVTSTASSMPELLGDAGFAVDPDDVNGLAGAILSCLVDDDLAADLRRRGPEQAARFRWTWAAEHTLAAYQAAVDGKDVGEVGACAS
jgi:glycosyltransferase involved in cell wall biosynthesis